jgi:hypothetical protein
MLPLRLDLKPALKKKKTTPTSFPKVAGKNPMSPSHFYPPYALPTSRPIKNSFNTFLKPNPCFEIP